MGAKAVVRWFFYIWGLWTIFGAVFAFTQGKEVFENLDTVSISSYEVLDIFNIDPTLFFVGRLVFGLILIIIGTRLKDNPESVRGFYKPSYYRA